MNKKFICALDAEFVALSSEETEVKSDGSKSIFRPARLSLGRVSVLLEDGFHIFIKRNSIYRYAKIIKDDWILSSESIVDYLTEFSGIKSWIL